VSNEEIGAQHDFTMKKSAIGSTTKKNNLLEQLLRENAQILFLPAGCAELQDSNYEPYLDCKVPEAAIYLACGKSNWVGIGDGAKSVILLDIDGAELKFNPAFRKEIPPDAEQSLEHLFENLEGKHNERCMIDFLEWIYRARPTRLEAVVRYFLRTRVCWLIGLSASSRSNSLFSEKPIRGDEAGHHWHRLCHLGIGEPLRVVVQPHHAAWRVPI
jgi:hypothetical protein